MLELTLTLWNDTSPAAELLDAGTRLTSDLTATTRELLSTAIADAHGGVFDLARTDPRGAR